MTTYWYLTRASGVVALLLLTLSVAVGVSAIGRLQRPGLPRFLVDGLHRTSALLALVFLIIHIATAVLDSFAPITLIDAVVPFAGTYRPLWLGLGATAFDLLLAVVVTSLIRVRVGYRGWRAVHWLSYAAWPVALLHGLGTGSDVKQTWMLVVALGCLAVVVAAVAVRAMIGWPAHVRMRVGALGMTAVFSLGLVVWLPGGPLGAHWARRSGTPSHLLGPTRPRS